MTLVKARREEVPFSDGDRVHSSKVPTTDCKVDVTFRDRQRGEGDDMHRRKKKGQRPRFSYSLQLALYYGISHSVMHTMFVIYILRRFTNVGCFVVMKNFVLI